MKSVCSFAAIVFFVVLTLTGCKSSGNATGDVSQQPNMVQLAGREYLLVLPQTFEQSKTYPVVMAFHFSGGTAQSMAKLTLLDQQNTDYIVVYPQAEVEEWNEGCDCNKPARLGIDDVAFVDAIIDDLQSKYTIDTGRIFATGYSQGGLFVQNLACKRSDVFRAVAVVAAPMSVQLAGNCKPAGPISVLMIHAEDDQVLPFYGVDHFNFGLISSVDAAQFWATHNQLQLDRQWQYLPGNIRLRSSDGSHYKVKLYSPQNGGHSWSFAGLNSSEVVKAFFAEH